MTTRYAYGGDEFIFVELSEEMNLETHFKGLAMTKKLRELDLPAVSDICSSNASYMVRFNPDELHPDDLIHKLRQIEESVVDLSDFVINSRLVDIPILFNDPWTHEALMRFRDRHQDPNATDLEYAARVNGYDSVDSFINAITSYPFLVSMVGFVPGLPWCFQMVSREKQIEVPKYVRPRTYTPERAFGFGGAFAVIYPVQGAGGYQLFGVAPAPIFDRDQTLPDFKDSLIFPQQGDIFRFRSITENEFGSIRDQVENHTFTYRTKDFSFTPEEVMENPEEFSEKVLGRLYTND